MKSTVQQCRRIVDLAFDILEAEGSRPRFEDLVLEGSRSAWVASGYEQHDNKAVAERVVKVANAYPKLPGELALLLASGIRDTSDYYELDREKQCEVTRIRLNRLARIKPHPTLVEFANDPFGA